MLITCGREGDAGILGMKRARSATDDSLIRSSSTNEEFGGKSCNKNDNHNHKSHFNYYHDSSFLHIN